MIDAFSMDIELRAVRLGSHIEAVLEFCEEKNIEDYYDVTELLHPIVLEKLKSEFIQKKFFRDRTVSRSINEVFK
jgi:hypothetical protein